MFTLDLEDITTRIRSYFQEPIIKRGWNYYLDHVVTNLSIKNNILRALVNGTDLYHVTIDLTEFTSSSCSCPYDDFCKHMAAVLFEALNQAGLQVLEFLHPKMIRKASQLPQTSPPPIHKKQAFPGPSQSDSVKDWHAFFATRMEQHSFPAYSSFESLFWNGQNLLVPYCRDFEPDRQTLFRIHVWLFLMKHLEKMHEQRNTQSFYLDRAFYSPGLNERWLHDLSAMVGNLNSQDIRQQHENYLLDTIEFLIQNAFLAHQTLMDWSAVYTILWDRLLFHEPWVEAEQQRLQLELATKNHSAIYKDHVIKSLLFFNIVTGQDDHKAMELADSLHEQDPALYFPYLRSFADSNQWRRLVEWLHWLKPRIKQADRSLTAAYLRFWENAYREQQVEEQEWEQTLQFMLPDSYVDYYYFLLLKEKYRSWVDLHLFYEISPLELKAGDLKEVAAQDRRLLLPLYHQAIERLILEKNRDSYKKSVRLLKKLRTHYKQLKQQPRWEQYIETLSVRYKRYRAFQEELQKGNLIP